MSNEKKPPIVPDGGIGSLVGSVSKLELDMLWNDLKVAPNAMSAAELRLLCQNLGEKVVILRKSLSAMTGTGPSELQFGDVYLASKAWAQTGAKVRARLKAGEGTVKANKSRKIDLTEDMLNAVINAAVTLKIQSGRLPGKARTAKLARQLLSSQGMQANQRKIVTESRTEIVLKELRAIEIAGQWPTP